MYEIIDDQFDPFECLHDAGQRNTRASAIIAPETVADCSSENISFRATECEAVEPNIGRTCGFKSGSSVVRFVFNMRVTLEQKTGNSDRSLTE
jgi:hypothetical protein